MKNKTKINKNKNDPCFTANYDDLLLWYSDWGDKTLWPPLDKIIGQKVGKLRNKWERGKNR